MCAGPVVQQGHVVVLLRPQQHVLEEMEVLFTWSHLGDLWNEGGGSGDSDADDNEEEEEQRRRGKRRNKTTNNVKLIATTFFALDDVLHRLVIVDACGGWVRFLPHTPLAVPRCPWEGLGKDSACISAPPPREPVSGE